METPSILVVDDEPGILETVYDILDIKGYKVAMAENGAKGVALVSKQYFDIVLIDIVMPEMNGVEAYNHIKRISPDTRVIMMTGYGSDHPLVKSALKSGVERLLHKPFEIKNMLGVIDEAVNHAPMLV
ncbi:MAG: response regulator [Chloroflexi bacterium]|jgi:DNA-binding NtrC family response regulator|nr:response regulator [Chloroflexota bacterium]MBT7080007.1 response regulator [Chloroflexota bacterium]MBT7289854.1 response regulator [Chloroflexota bacterium]